MTETCSCCHVNLDPDDDHHFDGVDPLCAAAFLELPPRTQRVALAASVMRSKLPAGWTLYILDHRSIQADTNNRYISAIEVKGRWFWTLSTRISDGWDRVDGDAPTIEWAIDEMLALFDVVDVIPSGGEV